MTARRAFVTGASGFVGRALVRRLAADGDAVVAIVRTGGAAPPTAGFPEGVEVRGIDWNAPASLARALEGVEGAALHHLAGRRVSPGGLAENLRANAHPLALVLDAVRDRAPAALVHVSSADVYGPQPPPCREDGPLAPVTPYGAAKLAAEELGRAAWRGSGTPFVVARPAVVYGPGQSPEMFVPQLIAAAIARTPFAMSPGEQRRDFVHVDDVAAALAALGRASGVAGRAFNVGNGVSVRLRDVAERLAACFDPPAGLNVGALPYRPGEEMEVRLPSESLAAATGWRPAIALEAGLRQTAESAIMTVPPAVSRPS